MTNKKEKFDLQPHDIDALADALASFAGGNKFIARMATTSPRGKKGLKLTYQFKIKLRGITKPPVWRRVLVPAHFTFTGFHAVIQEAFGWWNVHLYCFCDRQYGRMLNIAEVREDDWGYAPDFDARKFTVGEFFGDGGIVNKLCYVYDFGDDWTHDITLEKVLDEYSDHATCITGKGACPEEDCGGQWGYEDMKENGEIDDPKFFDLEAAKASVEAVEPEGFGPW
ncbi:plasmid pRiA4b ORF-3 family protein [Hoylesella timonensis]|uniref:Plasmid pRiA4b ORF-3 family protein n=1 Tax=Hoylesella timonensis TaxID=386414 RepID=A0A2N6Q5Q1_9BACT|nr:plasmid pRiA4b ORF-3 family protein [Hoylesella timonensis]PMC10334.1 plasmid pRiA4b ORF-3 family protein [Hoylesella timonensis]